MLKLPVYMCWQLGGDGVPVSSNGCFFLLIVGMPGVGFVVLVVGLGS